MRADFQITDRNAGAIAELCRRLEGIPLAVELAAAWSRTLSTAQMLSQLERRFDFLVGRQRDLPGRHRTLRAAIDWSYHLLSPELQRFFAGLSVFRGGWTAEAAAAVCEEPAALDFLIQLREASLVEVETVDDGRETPQGETADQANPAESERTAGVTRYRMLETLREYAAAQLSSKEQVAASRRHADHYLALVERTEPIIRNPDRIEALAVDMENLRAALAWCVEAVVSGQWMVGNPAGQGPVTDPPLSELPTAHYPLPTADEVGLRLAGALRYLWVKLGLRAEGCRWIETLLAGGSDAAPAVRAKALWTLAFLAHYLGDHARAAQRAVESLELYRRLDDQRTVSDLLAFLGETTLARGDHDEGERLLREAIALCEALENHEGHACALGSLAHLALRHGDSERAIAYHEESLVHFRKTGIRSSLNGPLGELGYVHLRRGDPERAMALFEEQLALGHEQNDRGVIARAQWHLGLVSTYSGSYERARALFTECLVVFRERGHKTCIADALHGLGMVAERTGDYPAAQAFHGEALAIRREMQDPWDIANSLDRLGWVALRQGNLAAARAILDECQALFRQVGDQRGLAGILFSQGALALCQGAFAEAQRLLRESLTLRREVGDRPGIAQCFEALAALRVHPAHASPDSLPSAAQQAARLLGAAESVRQAIGAPLPPAEREEYDRGLAAARDLLGEAELASLWVDGTQMALADAVALALGEARPA